MSTQVVQVPRVPKHPNEAFSVSFRYTTDKLPSGSTISSGTASAVDLSDNSDATTIVLASPTAAVSGGGLVVAVSVQAGIDGRDYRITINSTLTSGEVFTDTFLLKVEIAPQ